jgi:hypothetical protein
MASYANTPGEAAATTNQARTFSRGHLGLMLASVVLFSFNGGMCVTLGLRQGSPEHTLFLVTGCCSVLVAGFQAFVIVLKTRTSNSSRS